MPWCRFFVPKIASPNVKSGDPDLNEHISYAKCIKGHVLRDAGGWILCENLPEPDATCWQEGGETLLTIKPRKSNAENASLATTSKPQGQQAATTRARKS